MDQHVDTERRHPLEREKVQLVLKLRLQEIFHTQFFSAHDRAAAAIRRRDRRLNSRGRKLKREHSDFIRRDHNMNFVEDVWRELIDAQQDALDQRKHHNRNIFDSPRPYRSAAVYLYVPNFDFLPDFASDLWWKYCFDRKVGFFLLRC